jgi:PAS domain S-box-containing protein
MTSDESHKKIEYLERRLQREKTARIAAESILEAKSKEVYLSNQNLVKAVSDLEKLTIAVEQSPIIVLMTDIKGIVEYVNQSFTVISGYTKRQVMGKHIRSLGLVLDKEPTEGIKYVMQNKALWQGEIQGKSASKHIYKLKISISPILDKAQNITHFQFNCEDVTLQKENEERIYNLAHHDSLTKLYNRFSINSILQQAVSSAERNKSIIYRH